jgi:hypothetical protein
MGFSEPVINEGGTYTALFQSDPSVPGAAARIDVTLNVGEGDWTGDALDGLFQALVDLVDASPLFEFVQASKAQNTSTTITPTVAESP